MSLIQEALKRQQQEHDPDAVDSVVNNPMPTPPQPAKEIKQPELNSPSTAPIPEPPSTPPPPPPPPSTQQPSQKKTLGLADKGKASTPEHAIEPEFLKIAKEEKKQKSPWLKLIFFLIFLLLIIGLASWMVIYAVRNFTAKEPSTAKPAKTTKTTHPKVTKPAPHEAKKEKSNSETNKESIFKHLLTKEKKKLEEKPQPPSEPQKVSIAWPHLKISGAMAIKSGQGQAIINGKYISVGEQIEGVTLVKIKGNQVILQYKGEQRTVNVGTVVQ